MFRVFFRILERFSRVFWGLPLGGRKCRNRVGLPGIGSSLPHSRSGRFNTDWYATLCMMGITGRGHTP